MRFDAVLRTSDESNVADAPTAAPLCTCRLTGVTSSYQSYWWHQAQMCGIGGGGMACALSTLHSTVHPNTATERGISSFSLLSHSPNCLGQTFVTALNCQLCTLHPAPSPTPDPLAFTPCFGFWILGLGFRLTLTPCLGFRV